MSSNDGEKKGVKTDLRFDDGFPDGVFTEPYSANQWKVKVRALFDYCKEKGVEPNELTEKEMEQFLEYNKSEKRSE